ncbi:MAG: sulfatase-like hydrolase/transferase [Phenylobacterium sp.]|uniref:sulfatase-like hydrolase/transferase n=1 Tax=Phenylobacterium sp. TaxID=1871053 RepID=UPI00260015A3|nr:sulfatase-like hydrolase/transferase [Phenylobacterium sp.]MBI1198350.1 sulfatase-like hydrolase/transferase [Phenylobacterium sp.]
MSWTVDRRVFVGGMGAMAAAGLQGSARAADGRRLNVLMIITDQEQSPASWPTGLLEKLPHHRELLERGLLIENYHVQTTPCSPSRSTIFSGHHTQQTGVYLNTDTPPNPVPADDMPTLGHMLQAAGYYTSYKGKWHLSQINKERNWNQVPGGIYPTTENAMEKYGFHDYGFDGESVGLTWDGYRSDLFVAADASRALFDYARRDKAGGKPWFQVVGLVNPHDIMFYDATGHQAEGRPDPNILGPLRREPGDPIYEVDNGFDLPESFYKDDLSTKPEAHRAIVRLNDLFYGPIPHSDEASWHRFINYYYNCLRDVDRRLGQILWALKASGQMDNTIIVYTTDHGERAAAHGMRQKAGTMYREEVNVPMIIVHPDFPGGRRTQRLMSAIDLAPTLMGLAGMTPAQAAERFPGLPGVDVGGLLADASAPTERDRRGHLFDYAVAYMWEPRKGGRPNTTQGALDYDKIYDLSKRRLHRGVHDGRWKFARYFAPAQHHTPKDWETLNRLNDLELYDTQADPHEITNLAYDPAQRKNVLRLNAMVTDLIAREIGRDDGSEYPGPTSIYNTLG